MNSRAQNTQELLDDLREFDVHPVRGFLPPSDPLIQLPSAFEHWEQIAAELPKLLSARQLRGVLDELPVLDGSKLRGDDQLQRAMMLLSYFGHGYVWGEPKPAQRVPGGLAVPWYKVSQKLGRPPVLSYASYALYNWRRVDPKGPIALGNIVLLQNFLAGIDEEWFILVHVDIEAKAGAALAAFGPAREAVHDSDPEQLERSLTAIAGALERMNATLNRMPEHCDPYIYYNRVRPYLYGWKNQPVLPDGLIYEGVDAYGGKPQQFRGETGAQSSIIPSLDALLGIEHKADPLKAYLMEMRDYMPPPHRGFIAAVEQGPSVRDYVLENHKQHPPLRDAYNACVSGVEKFRHKHFEYAAQYIQQQAQRDAANPTEIGTGGTPFMPYLGKHLSETTDHLIPP